jgi:hypothetical protein
LAQGGGEVVVLAGVMYVMSSPQQVALMAGSMEAVIACKISAKN